MFSDDIGVPTALMVAPMKLDCGCHRNPVPQMRSFVMERILNIVSIICNNMLNSDCGALKCRTP